MTDQGPPPFDNWKDAWEWHAQETGRLQDKLPDDDLLAQISAGAYDPYYQIWYTLRLKTTLAKAAPVLLTVLRREVGDSPMLIRYHCAAALFYLLGYPDEPIPELRAAAQWDHDGEEARQKAVDTVAALVQTRLNETQP